MPTLGHSIELMGIADLKFTPNGGSSKDIYGVRKLTIDIDGVAKPAEGDDKMLAYNSAIKGGKVAFESMGISLDALGALTGQTVADTGSTPNQIATLNIKTGASPYGVLEGQGTLIQGPVATVPADVHFKIPKFQVIASDIKISMGFEDMAVISGGGYALPDASNISVTLVFNETAVPITCLLYTSPSPRD